jgi:hypothetical protein
VEPVGTITPRRADNERLDRSAPFGSHGQDEAVCLCSCGHFGAEVLVDEDADPAKRRPRAQRPRAPS